MPGLLLLVMLLSPTQDPKDADADRARRAAIVDKVMREPPNVNVQLRNAQAIAQAQQQLRLAQAQQQLAQLQFANGKHLTLEMKAPVPDPDAADADQPVQVVARPVGINIMEMAVASDNFDQWLFEDTRSDEGRKNQLDYLLAEKIHAVRKVRELDREQAAKLRLAGRGDIKRFLDRVESARTEFEAVRQDYHAGRVALSQLEPLTAEYHTGPFGADSLFEKALRKINAGPDLKPSGRGESGR